MMLNRMTKSAFILFVAALSSILSVSGAFSIGRHTASCSSQRVVATRLEMRGVPNDARGDECSRRQLLSGTTAAAAAAAMMAAGWAQPALAETLALDTFVDESLGFTMSVPATWTKSEQELPDRRKLDLFIDPNDSKSLVFMAYTPVRDDYTSLGSFGTVDQVAQMTILPKGELMGNEGVSSKMLLAEQSKNSYIFDYRQQVPGQPETHFRSIFTLLQGATGGAGAVLLTITAQTPEVRYNDELQPMFDEIINSYKLRKK